MIERFDIIQSITKEIKFDCELDEFVMVLYGTSSEDKAFTEDWLIPRMNKIFTEKGKKYQILTPDRDFPSGSKNLADTQIINDINDDRCLKVVTIFSSQFPKNLGIGKRRMP